MAKRRDVVPRRGQGRDGDAEAEHGDGVQGQPPGGDAARAQGCLCPVLDNARGIGYLGVPGQWVMRTDCPLHGGAPYAGRDEHHAPAHTTADAQRSAG